MRPFLEKLTVKFDIQKLRSQALEIQSTLTPVDHIFHSQSWGVVTNGADYKSGFDHYIPFRNGPGDKSPSKQEGLAQGAKFFIQDDCVKTNICVGYFAEVINTLNDMGFHVRRCRMNLLKPLSSTFFHKDTTTEGYGACIHIPIITHPRAIFENPNSSHHLPADGAVYIADISQTHRFRNDSLYSRFHLIMGVWDTLGVSKGFRWSPEMYKPGA